MKVTIGSTTYTTIRNLSFSPQVDITGDTIPINEFTVQIKTTNDIAVGQWASLYDDLNNLWAKYWIMYADRVDAQFVEVKAQSIIALLDRVTMDATIYDAYTMAGTVITACFTAAGVSTGFTIDSSIQGTTLVEQLTAASVIGYLPEQTARERLQWVCFVIGAYVKQHGSQNVEIKGLDQSTLTYIPKNKTFWKPSIEYKDYVTQISITGYDFTERTPQQGEEYVTVNDTNYVVTSQKYTLTNSEAPESALPNEINIDGCYLVNDDNADEILSRLALLYFERKEITADVINNNEYKPPMKVAVQLDVSPDANGKIHDAVGYIESADFRFGMQARSTLKIVASQTRELVELIVNYTFNGETIKTEHYAFPSGYSYSILNPIIGRSTGDHRYVYRPLTEYCTGTMGSTTTTKTVACEMALHWYKKEKLLRILSVSDVEYDSTNKVVEIN